GARRRVRGSGRIGASDRVGAPGPRLRAAAAGGGVPVRGRRLRREARLLDLRLQARCVLAVCSDGPGAGAGQRRGARVEGQVGAGVADRAGLDAVVRALQRTALAAFAALALVGTAGSQEQPPLRGVVLERAM